MPVVCRQWRAARDRRPWRCQDRQRDLDQLALRLLALRQPIARDLREIFAAFELICDYAANRSIRTPEHLSAAITPVAAAEKKVEKCNTETRRTRRDRIGRTPSSYRRRRSIHSPERLVTCSINRRRVSLGSLHTARPLQPRVLG